MLKTLKKFFAFCGVDNRRLFITSIWLGVVSAIALPCVFRQPPSSFRRCWKGTSLWQLYGRASALS